MGKTFKDRREFKSQDNSRSYRHRRYQLEEQDYEDYEDYLAALDEEMDALENDYRFDWDHDY